MVEKDLVRQLELEINQKHTFKNAQLAQQYEDKLKEMEEDEFNGSEEDGDVVNLNDYTAQRRSPLKRNKQGSGAEDDGKLLTSRASRLDN